MTLLEILKNDRYIIRYKCSGCEIKTKKSYIHCNVECKEKGLLRLLHRENIIITQNKL